MLDAISVAVQIPSAIIISRYDPSHSSGPMMCPIWPVNGHWNAAWQSCQQLENYAGVPIFLSFAFDDPSPAAFECALAMFTLATLYLYNSCQGYRYHKYSLVVAVGTAVIASITRHFVMFDEPLAHSIQISLPTSIMVASIVNTIIHQSGYLGTSRGQEPEPVWKQNIYIKDLYKDTNAIAKPFHEKRKHLRKDTEEARSKVHKEDIEKLENEHSMHDKLNKSEDGGAF